MQRKQRNLFILGTISFAIGLFAILGVVQTRSYLKTAAISQDIKGIQNTFPSIGGAFQLVDKHGKVWKDIDFRGKPLLVYFGYSYCPDVCPTALSNLTKAMEELGGGTIVHSLFITLDPERDTFENLKAYSQNFHKDLIMLTGSKTQIEQATKVYRVHASRAFEGEGEDYRVDHSSLIYLMDKNGNYTAHFDHQTPPKEIVKRVRQYLEKGE